MGDDPFWMAGVLEPAPLGPAERRAAAGALAAAVQVWGRGGGEMQVAVVTGSMREQSFACLVHVR